MLDKIEEVIEVEAVVFLEISKGVCPTSTLIGKGIDNPQVS